MEIKNEINLTSKSHLTCINEEKLARQKRRPEDADAVLAAWNETFGVLCDTCGHKHARHSPCQEGGDG